jgi:hypothetical protein
MSEIKVTQPQLKLLEDTLVILSGYLTQSEWKQIDQSLTELLWRFADDKIQKTLGDGVKHPERPKRPYWRPRTAPREKENARGLVRQAVRDGTIKKPHTCEKCGLARLLHGHHEDYSKPLDVLWLCASCHAKEHKGEQAALLILNSKPLPRWGLC